MKKIILLFFINLPFVTNCFSQFSADETSTKNSLNSEGSNSWSVGGGLSNFIMHGDMRSFGTSDDNTYWNFGIFGNVNKMFNPLFGVEFKATYSKISGGAQKSFNGYDVKYANENLNKNDLMFKGFSYGAEFNLILNFINLNETKNNKYVGTGYFGLGYQLYNSSLYNRLEDGSYSKLPSADFKSTSSVYLSGQFGLKRKINKRFDIEFRTGMYFNYEDNLDAAISDKQNWETYIVSSIGMIVKLGKKDVFSTWSGKKSTVESFKIIDTDKDGVMDQLDIEPTTPEGVMVYGNGKAVDSDKDKLADYKDKCPLKYGSISNEGCPLELDSDGDGIEDTQDLCPSIIGGIEYRGCPKPKIININNINQQIGSLASHIYFDSNSDKIKPVSYSTIDEIINLMKNVPNIKFIIEGHTDNKNSAKHNLYLSKRRAFNVKKYLIKKGVDGKKIETKGYGESRPKFSNFNAGGRQLNRRVEIKTATVSQD